MIRKWALCAILLLTGFTGAAQAESMQWKIRSFDSKAVDVKFFSASRKNTVWPGDNKVFTIKNHDQQTYNLSCIKDEKICYGAWQHDNDAKFWGVGHAGKAACKTCCYTCGSSSPNVSLNE